MALAESHWFSMGEPATPAEAAAMEKLRQLLPDSPHVFAWSNVTLRTPDGRADEIDVIMLHPVGLFVLELKGWHGRINAKQQWWGVNGREKRDPFILNNQKAQRFKSALSEAARRRRTMAPFVRAVTVMHGSDSVFEAEEAVRATTVALDGYRVTGLRSFSELFQEPEQLGAETIHQTVRLINDLGLRPRRRQRTFGQYVVTEARVLDEGPGWQDFRAEHPGLRDYRRLRLFHFPVKATQGDREAIERDARREYELTRFLGSQSIIAPLEYLSTEEGPVLVFPDDSDEVPLDSYLRQHDLPFPQRVALIRQIGEVVAHAHRRGVQHRALAPSAVRIAVRDDRPEVRIRDWQVGGHPEQDQRPTMLGVSQVAAQVAEASWLYVAPEAHRESPAGVPLDVYGLGALAYLILTGAPPAADVEALQQRLRSGGLDPSADRDGLPDKLCELVRSATDPDLGRRLASVAEFLDGLTASVEQEKAPPRDPRDAEPGEFIRNRWEVVDRLGAGSTGVALLVNDYDLEREVVVLKLAQNEQAAHRLRDEAEVLRRLQHPRVTKLLDGPLEVEGHTAIVVENAGQPTLGRLLAEQGSLTLEQLRNFGADLFEIAGYLESQRVFHRDIKPDNLGVREDPSDGRKHLVLFDFSLSREPLEQITSGTHGYLDPFLRSAGRMRYDSAAERFAVAATLYEMAAGKRPVFGDGRSDPVTTNAQPVVEADDFEPEVGAAMAGFFRTALAGGARDRFDNLSTMADAWARIFPSTRYSHTQELPQEERDRLALAANFGTPLDRAGLTLNALSAARRLGAHTVGELLEVSGFKINNEPGLGVVVRRELQQRRRQWSEQFQTRTSSAEEEAELRVRGVEAVQSSLVPRSNSRAAIAAGLARRLLNLEQGDAAWPDLHTAAREAGVTEDAIVVYEQLAGYWARSQVARNVLGQVTEALDAMGGIATASELAGRLAALHGSKAEGEQRRRNAIGLVRAAVEGDGGVTLATRRFDGEVIVVRADEGDPEQRLDSAVRVTKLVRSAMRDAKVPLGPNAGRDLMRRDQAFEGLGLLDARRALLLAANASGIADVSSRGELYPIGMPPEAALAAVLDGVSRRITPLQLRTRVVQRFPRAAALPDDAGLRRLVAGVSNMAWLPEEGAFQRELPSNTLLLTQQAAAQIAYNPVDEALRLSLRDRAAVVVTCPPARVPEVSRRLADTYGVRVVDVTSELIRAMRALAQRAGVDWDVVLRADAAAPGSADRSNLVRLVADAVHSFWPEVVASADPLLLTDCEPLARYEQMQLLAELLDTATARPAARWVLVGKRSGARVPTLEQKALPMPGGTWVELAEEVRKAG